MKQYTDCAEVREDISAYFDGELSAGERELIDKHLRDCAGCLRELDALKRVNDVYAKLERVDAPADFQTDVRQRVAGGGGTTVTFRPRSAPRWAGPLVALAAAGVVLIGGVVVLESLRGSPTEFSAAPMSMAQLEADELDALGDAPPPQAPAREGAWESFAGGDAVDSEVSEGLKKEDAGEWDTFLRAAEPSAASAGVVGGAESEESTAPEDELRGRSDDNGLRQRMVAVPATPSPALEEQAAAPLADDRSAILGEPSSALPRSRAESLKDAAEESERNSNQAKALIQGQTDHAEASGEVVQQRTLRSFSVGSDGTWYESGYEDQPLTRLDRESDALRELMKQHPGFTWNKLLDRPYRQVFQLGDAWYDLEAVAAQQ